MRAKVLVPMLAGMVGLGAFGVYAYQCMQSHSSASQSASMDAQSAQQGEVAGEFDLSMAGCRFACATKREYKAEEVVHQPGAKETDLTQCPVSGVVFTVDAERPRETHAGHEYVFCCDTCAKKFHANPGRFLKA